MKSVARNPPKNRRAFRRDCEMVNKKRMNEGTAATMLNIVPIPAAIPAESDFPPERKNTPSTVKAVASFQPVKRSACWRLRVEKRNEAHAIHPARVPHSRFARKKRSTPVRMLAERGMALRSVGEYPKSIVNGVRRRSSAGG